MDLLLLSGEQYFHADKVVLASGGLSMPKISSDLAFRTARQFGLDVVETVPALVRLRGTTQTGNALRNLVGYLYQPL